MNSQQTRTCNDSYYCNTTNGEPTLTQFCSVPTPTPTQPVQTGNNPPVITNVQAINITSNAATVTWTTNEYSDSEVYLGTQPGTYTSSPSNSGTVSANGNYMHSVALSNLNPGTTYYFKVASIDNGGNKGVSSEFSFPTQAAPVGCLTATLNNALGTQNAFAGATIEIGSYALTASSVEGVKISNVSIQTNGVSNGSFGSPFQNLKVMVGGAQFGATQTTVASGTIYTFSGTPFVVSAGSTVNVNIYADTLSSAPAATTISPATILANLSGAGVISSGAISLANPVSGQNVQLGMGATIRIGADSTQAPSGQIVMGATGNSLATFRAMETSNAENVRITDLTVTDAVSPTGAKAAFSNLTLWNGSTALGTAGSAVPTGNGYTYSFHFSTPVIVPQANSVSLVLKGDASSYSNSGATDNSVHTFSIVNTTDVTALGATSNRVATISSVSGAMGNPHTILRSVLIAWVAPMGSTSGRSKGNPDDFGTVTVSANVAGPVALTSLRVAFTGSAATDALGTILIDANGQDVVAAGEATESAIPGASTQWTFAGNGFQISAGSSYTFRLRMNTVNIPGQNGISESLSANIQNPGDLTYSDALDSSATTGLTLTPSAFPLTINSVMYAQGN